MNDMLIISSVGLWVVLIVNLLLTFALVRRVNQYAKLTNSPQGAGGLGKGEKAPDFQATTLLGEPVSLAHYAGRAVAFLFVSPHCGPCRDSLPQYLSWHRQALRSGLEMVLVSDSDTTEAKTFADELSIDMPMLVAPRGTSSFSGDYKVSGTPTYTLLNAQGTVLSSGHPGDDWRSWHGASELASDQAPPIATLVPSQG